jgi:hypothetical protein
MGDNASFPYRGFFPSEDLARMKRLLDNPDFVARLHARTPKMSHALRLAIALGIEELERKYGIRGEP